jgi:hypothetical protein
VRRLFVDRIKEAQVIEAVADPPGQLVPGTGVPARRVDDGDAGIAPGEPIHHLPSAHDLGMVGRERHAMSPFGQTFDGRLEQAQVRIVADEEQDLHGCSDFPGTSPGRDRRRTRSLSPCMATSARYTA